MPVTMQGPVVYLGTTITKIPSQVDPFYMTLLINGKYANNCMIDSGDSINIMPIGVMRDLGLKVDFNYGKFYAMENRSIPIIGILKNLEGKIANFPKSTLR